MVSRVEMSERSPISPKSCRKRCQVYFGCQNKPDTFSEPDTFAGSLSVPATLAAAAAMALLAGCGGGSTAGSPPGAVDVAPPCNGSCASASTFLAASDVERTIAQAVAEATARSQPATIAVVDRVGNVLAVFAMTGAPASVTVTSGSGAIGGLEGVTVVPATLAAISKALTGAYLSSEGNAFSTRTASQIIQQNFNPGEVRAPGGPLFGVQFSQLPCADTNLRRTGPLPGPGPQRAPLGLAADPGGLPLYQAGTPVGGVGVVADGIYGLDLDIGNRDLDVDELIALAATFGHAAPDDRRADRITADGRTLRFSDAVFGDLRSDPGSAPAFGAINGVAGNLVAVPGYTDGTLQAGLAFGEPGTGIRPAGPAFAGLDAFVPTDAFDAPRFPPAPGSEPVVGLTTTEVTEILREALTVANRARAQIRRPVGSPARVTVSVVDSTGVVLGVLRSRDAPLFGLDVAIQKARTAALLSSTTAAADLNALPPAVYLDGGLTVLGTSAPGDYVQSLRDFLGSPTALADSATAWSARATGNITRPFFPDGVNGNAPGPFSRPAGAWSPFNTGLQLDTSYNAIIQHVAFVLGLAPDVGSSCAGVGGFDGGFTTVPATVALASGLQIFPGAVPVYRGDTLVGAVGVSGDGVDQDDMVAFLSVHQAGSTLGSFGNAPANLRSDRLTPGGNRLRYVNCPQAPFLDGSTTDACSGK
jgi:uncharacterized protein GlcG (DUF336 family)